MVPPSKNAEHTFSTPAAVFNWMESFTNLEARSHSFSNRTYRLDRMEYLLQLCDHPHRSYPVFHIAGSKGKGSTATFIAGALGAAGYRTGLYTSPHISSYLERITISGKPVKAALLTTTAERIKALISSINLKKVSDFAFPTTFELLTLLAFLVFREAGCEYVVLETGLGGRLDATNVVSPLATIITPIEKEHTEILGDTLEKIATEKAGIIKPGVPLFCSPQPPGAREVLQEYARLRQAPLYRAFEHTSITAVNINPGGTEFQLTLKRRETKHIKLRLLGSYQAENAALAYLTLTTCLPELPPRAILKGFAKTRLPGRMELFPGSPPFVLDGAHTPLSIQKTSELFFKLYPGNNILIFGAVLDKDYPTMAGLLAPRFKHIIISTPGTFKESNLKAISTSFRALNKQTFLQPDNRKAFKLARSLATKPGHCPSAVLICGSFYLVAEFRKFLV